MTRPKIKRAAEKICLAPLAVKIMGIYMSRTEPQTTGRAPFAEREAARFYLLLWSFTAAFGLHIVEESAGFASWVKNTLKGDIDIRAFYVNNAGFMALLILLTIFAVRRKSNFSLWLLFFWVSGQQFWNFIFHMYTQFHFRAYSPGYFTALFLYFPVYLYLSYLALRDHRLKVWQWLISFAAGAFGMWFTIWAGLYHFSRFPWEYWY